MKKKIDKRDPKAAEARRRWAREQLQANPSMPVWGGKGSLLQAMRDKFGVTIDSRAITQIRKEVLAAKGLKSPKSKAKSPAIAPVTYLSKQLETITKMLRKSLPDLTRFVMTTDEKGKTDVEYTMLQPVSGKVKL